MQGLAERMSPGSEYRSGAELREYQRRYDAAPPEARRRTLSEALTLANESLSLLAALIPGPHQMAAISHQVRVHRPNMDSVLQALALSDLRAKTLFVEKLSGLDVGAALLAAAKAIGKEFLIYVGGSVVVGTAVGAAIANAPGAAAGATTGARVGFALMNRLGIGFLILGGALSLKEAAGYYVKGFACAWVAAEVPEEHVAKRRQLMHQAVESMAQGHLFLMLAILQGIVAYVSKGTVPKADMYAKLKGADLADLANWAKANEPVLAGVPVLRQQANKSVGELVEAEQRTSAATTSNARGATATATTRKLTNAERYAELVNSNKPWSWKDDFPDGANLTAGQKAAIKRQALADGLIPNVPFKAGTRFPDFEAAGLVKKADDLPESLWKVGDGAQFSWLDRRIPGGRPKGYTWHHSDIPGRMELVPFGPHNIINHRGGRSAGMWAEGGR